MKSIILDLSISADEWLKIYRGQTNLVSARSRDGRTIQFPANILSRYTTHFGIQGSFQINFNDDGKVQSIQQLK